MKFLLAAVNAKYIHSNLGIYSLKAYGEKRWGEPQGAVELAEYTINHPAEWILQDIYKRGPDVIGLSCYIWNIHYIKRLVRDIPKVLPGVDIWLGGPEVSYDAVQILEREPDIKGIMKGEGEETFACLLMCYGDRFRSGDTAAFRSSLERIPGLIFRREDGGIGVNPDRAPMKLDRIPFPYDCPDSPLLEHRIMYYETSRGCPFSCSYCLSSIDRGVRFRSLELVYEELDRFLEWKIPQVKFVDRTFNCRKSHALAIWRYLTEHDNGVTNFHFEIGADLLDEEQLSILKTMRPGLVQLEIGVQSTNARTLEVIRRETCIDRIREVTAEINGFHNIHQHLDLIAGLPYEDYDSFRRSFNQVYQMKPAQLQLGFLKVLKGSYMEEQAQAYGLAYSGFPPYEVYSSRWITYEQILRLKRVEEMVEVYYNSCQFTHTLKALAAEYPSPYEMFEDMADYYEENRLNGISHSRLARFEILYQVICKRLKDGAVRYQTAVSDRGGDRIARYRDRLVCDLYLRENAKRRPFFASDQTAHKKRIREFFDSERERPCYLTGDGAPRQGYTAHVEVLEDGRMVLFDYEARDPLTHNARACLLNMTGENRQ